MSGQAAKDFRFSLRRSRPVKVNLPVDSSLAPVLFRFRVAGFEGIDETYIVAGSPAGYISVWKLDFLNRRAALFLRFQVVGGNTEEFHSGVTFYK